MNAEIDALVAKWREEAREVQKRYGMWQAQRMLDCADELERLAASRPAPAPQDADWLRRQAMAEDGGVVSAGGLVTDLSAPAPKTGPGIDRPHFVTGMSIVPIATTPPTGEAERLNVNEYVLVQLTESGRKICRALGRNEEQERWQLWDLMNVFGPALYLGSRDVPFVRNEIVLARATLATPDTLPPVEVGDWVLTRFLGRTIIPVLSASVIEAIDPADILEIRGQRHGVPFLWQRQETDR